VAAIAYAGMSFPSDPPSTADNQLHLYDYEYLSFDHKVSLPNIHANGKLYAVHGRYVFFTADGGRCIAVEQADSKSGLLHDFAIAVIALTRSLS
jgi:hypothetical protein